MRIQNYNRQQGLPTTTGTQKVQGMGTAEAGTARALAGTAYTMGRVAAAQQELEARQRESERAMKLDRLAMTYKVGYASWFETRAQDPMAYGTLMKDATDAQAKFRDEAFKEVADDQELQAALAFRFDEHDGLKRIEAQRVAGQQLAEVSRGQLRATLNDAASLYAGASGFERPDIMGGAVNAIGAQVRAGAITAEQGTVLAQEFTDTAFGNDIARRIEDDPRQVLDDIKGGRYAGATEKLLVAGERGARDEIKRRQAEAERERARAEAARDARLRVAERAVDSVGRILDAGVQVDAQTMKTARGLVAGTELEPVFNSMLVGYQDRARFAAAPIADQMDELRRMQKQATTAGTDENGIRELNARERILSAAMTAAKDDPLLGARDRGIIGDLTPIQMGTSAQLAESLQARTAAADAAAVWAGRPVSPMTRAETAALAETLNKAPAAQRREVLMGLRRGLDDQQFTATLAQLSKDSPLPAYAAALGMQEQAASQYAPGSASAMILQGDSLMRPAGGEKPFPMPTEAERRTAFSEQTSTVFDGRSGAAGQVRLAADAVYATLSAQAGDFSGVFDASRYRGAVQLATGGIVDVGNSRVIKPVGMSEDQFVDLVDKTDAAIINRLGGVAEYTDEQAAEAIRDGNLVNYGDGYAIRDGGRLLQRKDGRDVFVWRPAASALTLLQPKPRRHRMDWGR